MYKDKKKVDF